MAGFIQAENLGEKHSCGDTIIKDYCSKHVEIAPKKEQVEEALHHYSKYFGLQCEEEEAEFVGFDLQAFPWSSGTADQVKELSVEQARTELEKDLGIALGSFSQDQQFDFSTAAVSVDDDQDDSDCEELTLCPMCNLPLGDVLYRSESSCNGLNDTIHGECMALDMARKQRERQRVRLADEKLEKNSQREEYGIGWKVQHIPHNEIAASKLAVRDVPQGMVCLVLDEDSRSIRVAATVEPAASLNLDYLSTALEVRRREGHEPIFSLDPVDASDKASMQEKVFVPEWLAGTSAGEVLFQSDYHLKELSMGEHEQPVVGMKSCFHYSEHQQRDDWSAREWFMVRKAEVHITESCVLVPFVKMGVEAREQAVVGNSLEDLPITRPDHPMVRYAEAFTQNFDLIAERKSVVFHLRELAKAAVISKFLLDAQVTLDEQWFHLAQEHDVPCSLEVPQLWNKSMSSKIIVNDGVIKGRGRQHGVFGGVQFGLEKFDLSRGTARSAPTASALSMKTSLSQLAKPAARPFAQSLSSKPVQADRAPPGAALMAGQTQLMKPGFVDTLLSRAAAGSPLNLGSGTAARTSLQPPGMSMNTRQLGLKAPDLAAPRLGLDRMPGAPTSIGAASFVGKPPPGAPALQGHVPLRLTQAFPSPLTIRQPKLYPPAAALANIPAAGVLPMSATAIAPRVSAVASMPRLTTSLQASATAPKTDTSNGDEQLQGVDLRLDSFDLSEAKRISLEAKQGSWGGEAKCLDECVAVGDAFWSALDDKGDEHFKGEDRRLLQSIFNAELSDRRLEGAHFTPPDASHDYVQKLRSLVKKEEVVRQSRMEQFFSTSFKMTNPGALFPSSWSSGFEAHRCGAAVREAAERPQASLSQRPEYRGKAAEFVMQVAKTSAPVFDKSTEEGLRFRIYQMGTLEIRTTQMHNEEEQVGVVFSMRSPMSSGSRQREHISEQEKIMKATEYVEHASAASTSGHDRRARQARYYIVLETDTGHKISTERQRDGSLTWEENPDYLEDRNSLAKVIRVQDVSPNLTVRDMKVYHKTLAASGSSSCSASPSACKRYVRSMFARSVATPGDQVIAMPIRSARIATDVRRNGRPPVWSELTMASN